MQSQCSVGLARVLLPAQWHLPSLRKQTVPAPRVSSPDGCYPNAVQNTKVIESQAVEQQSEEDPVTIPPGAGNDSNFQCEDCPRTFTTKAGKSLHRRRAHAVQYLGEIESEASKPKRKTSWSVEEEILLAKAEAKFLWQFGKGTSLDTSVVDQAMMFRVPQGEICKYLSRYEQGGNGCLRSAEAIKKRRQTAPYQRFLKEQLHLLEEQALVCANQPQSSQCSPQSQAAEEVVETAAITSPEAETTNEVFADEVAAESAQAPVEATPTQGVESDSGRSEEAELPREPSDLCTPPPINKCTPESGDNTSDQQPMDPPNTISGDDRWQLPLHDLLRGDLEDVTIVPGAASDANQAEVDRAYKQFTQTFLNQAPKPTRSSGGLAKGRPVPVDRTQISNRQRKRRLFAKVQRGWTKDPSRTAKEVISGQWDKDSKPMDSQKMENFWRPLFETVSRQDNRNPAPVRETQWNLMDPIVVDDLRWALENSDGKKAPGPDGIKLAEVKKIPAQKVVDQLNLWLFAGCLPTELYGAQTSLIPKEVGTDDPKKFRPITVASVLVRLFHKIMVRRLDKACPASIRQKAYKEGDGLAENVILLNHILKTATNPDKPQKLCMALLDVRKAFDSVSHDTIEHALLRVGVPEPLVVYIARVYKLGFTRLLFGDGSKSEPITCGQGVRQGDPLSAFIFNAVIDWACSSLEDNIGVRVGRELVSHLAFADDLALFALTPKGLQHQLDAVVSALKLCGLDVNPDKCQSLRVMIVPRMKKFTIGTASFVKVDGKPLPVIGREDLFKYLGIYYNAKGSVIELKDSLNKMLGEVRKAPLKPQQRLYILRNNIIPKLLHQLVLADLALGVLRGLDITIRGSLRQWLRLPKDYANANFYAAINDGGLGLVSLEMTIPALKLARLERQSVSQDPAVIAVINSESFHAERSRFRRALGVDVNAIGIEPKSLVRDHWRSKLHDTVDGKGLTLTSTAVYGDWQRPVGHSWLTNAQSKVPGWRFQNMIQLRAGSLETKARKARRSGRGSQDPAAKCDVCVNHVDTLGHRLQTCPKAHGMRTDRHNRVLKLLVDRLERRGWKAIVEPSISTSEGKRIPDLIVSHPELASEKIKGGSTIYSHVVDVQICADNGVGDPDRAYYEKVNKYSSVPEVGQYALAETGKVADFGAMIWTWRGIPSNRTIQKLSSLGLGTWDINLLSQVVVEQSEWIWRQSRMSTARSLDPRLRNGLRRCAGS